MPYLVPSPRGKPFALPPEMTEGLHGLLRLSDIETVSGTSCAFAIFHIPIPATPTYGPGPASCSGCGARSWAAS